MEQFQSRNAAGASGLQSYQKPANPDDMFIANSLKVGEGIKVRSLLSSKAEPVRLNTESSRQQSPTFNYDRIRNSIKVQRKKDLYGDD